MRTCNDSICGGYFYADMWGTIRASNDCYKIRIAISSKGKGKSGGATAISYVYIESNTIYLLTIYDKSEKEDLKTNELKEMVVGLML